MFEKVGGQEHLKDFTNLVKAIVPDGMGKVKDPETGVSRDSNMLKLLKKIERNTRDRDREPASELSDESEEETDVPVPAIVVNEDHDQTIPTMSQLAASTKSAVVSTLGASRLRSTRGRHEPQPPAKPKR